MTPQHLFRLAGAGAITGGALRILAEFKLISDAAALEWLYAGIDILLLLGIMGIYLARASKLGFLGLASFAVAVAALSFIGGPDADPFGFSTYAQGAAVLAIAMVGFSLAWVRAGERPYAPAICWFASVLAVGLFSALSAAHYGLIAAGVLFGAGFMLAGWDLLRRTQGSAREL